MDSEDEFDLVIDEQEQVSEELEVVEEDLLSRVARMEEDVFLRMLLYLNCQSIASLEQTCHTLRNFISHSEIWKRKFLLRKTALERVEREQRINLQLDSQLCQKPALLRLEQMERNLTERKCRRDKTSFYEVVGFNGCESLVSALECSLLLVNEDNHGYLDGVVNPYSLYDLHKGGQTYLTFDNANGSFQVRRFLCKSISVAKISSRLTLWMIPSLFSDTCIIIEMRRRRRREGEYSTTTWIYSRFPPKIARESSAEDLSPVAGTVPAPKSN